MSCQAVKKYLKNGLKAVRREREKIRVGNKTDRYQKIDTNSEYCYAKCRPDRHESVEYRKP